MATSKKRSLPDGPKPLRREVHRLVLEGKSDAEVLAFMHQRYGDFILYDPQIKPGTWLLWFGPLALFLVALYVVFRISTGRKPPTDLSDDDESRLNQIISAAHSDK